MAERMDHEKMRPASALRVTEPAATTRERIPGEHDATTAMPTQPGTAGGTGFGDDLPETDTDASLSEEERRRSRWEGGGLVPRPGPDTEAYPGERPPDEAPPGSATGATGGGEPDAHRKTNA